VLFNLVYYNIRQETMSIGVGILGGGIFAREEHLPAVDASKNLTLKAVYSRSLKSAKTLETSSNVDLYSDDSGSGKGLDDLLARSDIHAVIIALPILNQPDYIKKSLLAGKHVLSEKPIAENLADAKELLKWYRSSIDTKKITWTVAENFRFLNTLDYAAEQIRKMGRVLSFSIRRCGYVEQGGKYFETSWRKSPTHQGGFLLDGGVHTTAGLRLLLGPDYPLASLSANTTQLQEHLPPVDTAEATLKTKNGVVGSISMSFGTTFKASDFYVACEKGVVSMSDHKTVKVGDESKDIEDERTGVPPEVRAWGEALAAGKPNPKQSPEEALADLEILEAMLKSGEKGGEPIPLTSQT